MIETQTVEVAKDERRYRRVAVDIPVSVAVMIPEDTFQPVVQEAVICDVSERGAMIKARFSQELLRQLFNKTRYCRLHISGIPELPEKITGIAVWLQPETKHGQVFKLGLFFSGMKMSASAQIRAFVAARPMQEETE